MRPIFLGAEHNDAARGFGDLATLIREALEFDNNDVNQRKEYLSGIVDQAKEELFTPERLSAGDYDLRVEEELGVAPQTAEKKGPKMSLAMDEETEFSIEGQRERSEVTEKANEAVLECLGRAGIEVGTTTQEEAREKAKQNGVDLIETSRISMASRMRI